MKNTSLSAPVKSSTETRCESCLGTGREQDNESLGKKLLARRKKAGMTLKGVADKMGKSEGYISDLERARRGWTLSLVIAYVAALGEPAKPSKKPQIKSKPRS